jgi:hypothetical protein
MSWKKLDEKPIGGIPLLVNYKDVNGKGKVREAYYNAGFKTWHIRSTMPNEQEDIQVYPTHWMYMPESPKD